MKRLIAAPLVILAGLPAHAEVAATSANSFEIRVQRQLAATPEASYRALGQIGRWWSDDHSWSGQARNMTLSLNIGDCFCGRWKDGQVEHGRVIHAVHGKLLRLNAPLGPLQSMTLNAILSFEFTPAAGGTQLTVTYRVIGDSTIAALAGGVDGVLTQQIDRYAQFLATGKPTR